jgi:hypothetical protein
MRGPKEDREGSRIDGRQKRKFRWSGPGTGRALGEKEGGKR